MNRVVRGFVLASGLALSLMVAPAAMAATLEEAQQLEQQGDWQQAKTVYAELHQQDPQDVQVLLNLARLTAWSKDYDGAYALYQQALNHAQNDFDKLEAELGKGQALSWGGKNPAAIGQYQATLKAYPDNPEVLFRLAQTEAWTSRVPQARAHYQAVLAQNPDHLGAKLGLAELDAWQGHYQRAINEYDDLLTEFPDNPEVWVGLGRAQGWRGDLLKAKDTLTKARQRFPGNDAVLTAYFQATQALGKPDMSVFQSGKADGFQQLEQARQQQAQLQRPAVQSVYTGHTEAGTVDEKLKFNRVSNQVTLYLSADTALNLTYEPTFYESGGDIESETRNLFGAGFTRQWTDRLRTSVWAGVADYSNGGGNPLFTNISLALRPNDAWQPTLRFDRYGVEESVLSASGLRPVVGVFANQLVGRVIRNEWTLQNVFRLPHQWVAQLNTAIGFDNGEQIEDNSFYKVEYQLGRSFLQRLTPTGSSRWYGNLEGKYWHFEDDRLNNGGAFLVVKPFGLPLGIDGVSPIPSATNPGTGGYFSPDHYWFNALRLGNRGQVWNQRLTYDLSAFLGYQDISRLGGSFARGVQLLGELLVTPTVSTLFGVNYNNAQQFEQVTFYLGLRKRI